MRMGVLNYCQINMPSQTDCLTHASFCFVFQFSVILVNTFPPTGNECCCRWKARHDLSSLWSNYKNSYAHMCSFWYGDDIWDLSCGHTSVLEKTRSSSGICWGLTQEAVRWVPSRSPTCSSLFLSQVLIDGVHLFIATTYPAKKIFANISCT